MASKKNIRYGKPCMTNLPPRLGRRIFETITHTPPFDYSKLDEQCARIERRFAKLSSEVVNYDVAEK